MNRILELRQKRAEAVAQARALNDKVQGEGRDFTAEEQEQWDRWMDEADRLRQQAEREERMAQYPADEEERGEDPRAGRADSRTNGQENREQRQMQLFRRYLPAWLTQNFRDFAPSELRALQAELDTAGGYLRPPMQFVNDLIRAVDDMVFIRQWATRYQVTSAESMGVPTLESDPADADWTSELATGSEDTAMSFGRRELHPHALAKRIKISRKLLRAVPSSEGLVRERLAYKFAITQEKAFLTGNGSGQPLGVFVATALGIPTTRDISTGNTTTAVTSDGLKEAKYSIKGAYWPRLRWMFHRDGVKMIAKLKDGEGQYIWTESIVQGEPDRLLGFPVAMSEFAPNTFTAGLYVGILGDFSNYWIADALSFELQLLQELYAETNQVGLIGRIETDGQPVLAEAFARVTLAAG